MIRALIFDLDGVLANTVSIHYQAWKQLAERYDIPFSQDDIDRFRGIQRRDFVVELFSPKLLTRVEIETYANLKNTFYLEGIQQASSEELIVPHAVELLRHAKRLGLKIGVASSSSNAVSTLNRIGLYDLIDVVADGNTVIRSKPAPDIFLWTAGGLQVRPTEVVVFEDAIAGITGAIIAGMFAVGVDKTEDLEGAHIVFSNLAAIQLEELLTVASHNVNPNSIPIQPVIESI